MRIFRKSFDRDDLQIAHPKPLSVQSVAWMINKLLNITGIRPAQKLTESMPHSRRTSLMQCHGFRKFFDTTCTTNGMHPLYVEKLMGHRLGLKGSYFIPTTQDLLEGNEKMSGYISIINDLTINDENRLRIKVTNIQQRLIQEREEKDRELRELRKQMSRYDSELESIKRDISAADGLMKREQERPHTMNEFYKEWPPGPKYCWKCFRMRLS